MLHSTHELTVHEDVASSETLHHG